MALAVDPVDQRALTLRSEAKARQAETEREQNYLAVFMAARQALAGGDIAEALRQADLALKLKPTEAAALEVKAAAEQELARVVAEREQKYEVRFTACRRALAGGDIAEALRQADLALELKPTEAAALRLKAAAEGELARAAAERERKYGSAMAAGRGALARRHFSEALRQAEVALRLKPNDGQAHHLQAEAGTAQAKEAEREQQYQEAMQAGKAAVQAGKAADSTQTTFGTTAFLGKVEVAEKQFEEAVQQADLALGVKPGDAEANKLKQAAGDELKYMSAMGQGKAAAALARYAVEEGKYAEAAGRFAEAVEQADLALGLKPGDNKAETLKQTASDELKLASAMVAGKAAVAKGNLTEAVRPGDDQAGDRKANASPKQNEWNNDATDSGTGPGKVAGGRADAGWAAEKRAGSPELSGGRIDLVQFSVIAPVGLLPGTSFVLEVWGHLKVQSERARVLAGEAARGGENSIHAKGEIHGALGAILAMKMNVDGLLITDPLKNILWDGETGKVRFAVMVPRDAWNGTHHGMGTIYLDRMQIAKIHFTLLVGAQASPATVIPIEVKHYRKAFASYASADRDEVLRRIQGLQKIAPGLDVVVDVLKFRSGEDWEKKLWQVIPESDVFYLFWSKAAKESSWVEKEWKCALSSRGKDFIDPVPLVSPEEAPPPQELRKKHLNDWELANRNGEKQKVKAWWKFWQWRFF
jgi:tetratricopeptide (TPR) repeat protein